MRTTISPALLISMLVALSMSIAKMNGFGGEKYPGNLAAVARAYAESDFTRWVLEPSSVRAGTSMPPLYRHIPDDERWRIAKALFDYLRAVPILQ